MADDGLSWLLSLDIEQDDALAFIKNLEKMMSSLKGTKTDVEKMEAAGRQAESGHKKHAAAAEHLDGVLHHLHKATLEPLAEKLKSIAEFEFIRRGVDAIIDLPERLAEKVIDLGKEALITAANGERMDLAFKLRLGNEGAESLLGWNEQIAKKTDYTVDQLKQYELQFLRAGVAAKDMPKYIAAAGDVAAMSGDKIGGMQTAVEALSRANLTGKVEGRVLRGLGIPVKELGELPQFKGLDERQINKRLETSTVSRDQLLGLIAGADRQLGDKMLEAGKTMGAKLKNLGELPELYFEKFNKLPAYDELKSKFTELYDSLDPSSPRGTAIFASLKGMFTTVVTEVGKIDFISLADTVEKRVLPDLEAMFEVAAKIAGAIGDAVHGFEVAGGLIHDFTPAGFIYDIGKARQAQIERHGGLGAELGSVGSKVAGLLGVGDGRSWLDQLSPTGFLPGHSRADQVGAQAAAGVAGGIDGGASMVRDAAGRLGDTATDALQKKLDIHSPSRVFADLGRMTAAGFVEGIDASVASVDAAVSEMFAAPKAGTGAGVLGGPRIVVSPGAVSLVLQLGHGASATNAETIGAEAARAVRSILPELISAIETAALEGGNVS